MLLVGWALSGWMFVLGHRQKVTADEAGFSRVVADAQQAIEQRMTTYVDALRSGASLIYALRRVERAEWMTFAETLDVPGRYPGINGIGVIFPVPPQETDAFLRRVRADWAPEFLIHPVPGGAAPARSEQYVITYIAPEAGNEAAVGLDVATESERRQAADAARDLGEPRITGRVTLVQDERQGPGFLLYVPVYRNGAPRATVAERRAALDAWVYAPFVTERFLASVVGTRVETFRLHVFERDQRDPAHLLYTSDPPGAGLPEFERMTSIDLAGQPFTLGWTKGPASRRPRGRP